MAHLQRRKVLAIGAAVTAAPLLTASSSAATERYGPEEGEEILPGVRQIDLEERDAIIPGYARVTLVDYVAQPGAEFEPMPMPNEMVCHMLEGEFEVYLDGEEFTAGKNAVWTCAEGKEEGWTNATDQVAIMRVTHLLRE